MADGKVEIKFLTDTKEIESARKLVMDLGTAIDKALNIDSAGSEFDEVGASAESAATKVEEVTEATDKATESMGELSDEVEKMSNTTEQATDSLGGLADEVDKIDDKPLDLPDDLEKVDTKAQKASGGIKSIVTAVGLLKVASVAISVINGSLDKAISRVDTMRQYPKMMQQVGFSNDQVTASLDKLSAGIDGLPTALDEVVATAQQLALTTGDLEQATDLTLALNNAFLASGSSGADASRGLQQFSQMLSSGKVDMQSWRTLLETMPLALQTVAENFGYTGAAAKNDLYAALQDGSITFDEFSQALIDANNAQGGFAEMAKTNSEGIATSFANIKTSVVKGVADVVIALDELIESISGKNIAQHADTMKVAIGGAFKTISSNIRDATPYVQSAISLFQRATPIVVGLGVAFTSFKILSSVSGWFKTLNDVTTVMNTTQAVQIGLTKALAAANITASGSQQALAVTMGLYTGSVNAATIATGLLNSAITFLTGPIGLTVAALGLLAGAGYIIYDSFKKATDGLYDYKDEMEGVITESQNLQTEIEGSATAFDESIADIDNHRGALQKVADKLDDLVGKEEKSASDKQLIKRYVDDLNASVEGLNLRYNEETDALNLSKDAIYEKIDAMTALAKSNAAYNRLTEIMEQQVSLEAQIKRNLLTLQESGGVKTIGGSQLGYVDDLAAETNDLIALYNELGGEAEQVEAILAQSLETIASTTEDSTGRQIVALEDLTDAQKQVIDDLTAKYNEYKDVATDMFGKLETTSDTSVSKMIENLQHNQQALADYASNMSLIRDAVAELDPSGEFIAALEALGPQAAGEVSNIASSIGSDNFTTLVETFTSGGEDAKNALLESLGLEESELPDGLTSLISEVETSLSEQIEDSELDQIGKIVFKKIGEGMEENEELLSDRLKASLSKSAEGLGEAFEDVEVDAEPLYLQFQTAVDELPPVVESVSPELNDSGKNLMDSTTEGLKSGTPALHEAEQSSIEQLPEIIDETAPEMNSSGENLMDETAKGVDAGSPAVATSAKTAATGGVTAFKTGSTGAYASGLNLGLSFRNGLEGSRSSIISTATSLANAATSAINKALQIASPSKKGTYSGRMLGQGVWGGMEDEISNVEAMSDLMAEKAIPEFKDYDLSRILSYPTFVASSVGRSVASSQPTDMSRTNELLERIYRKNPNLVADDGAILGRYTAMLDRENGIIARNNEVRRL